MTQLQTLEKAITEIETGPYILQLWKKSIEEGKIITIIQELKIEAKENRRWLVNILGEAVVQLVEKFNPVKEAEIVLGDLVEETRKQKDSRNYIAIRDLVRKCEALYTMAEL